MRSLIDCVTEHLVVHSLDMGDIEQYHHRAAKIGELGSQDIKRYIDDDQRLYLLVDGTVIVSYLIIEVKNTHWWAMEMRSYISGHGYATSLLAWVVKNEHAPIYNDIQLTVDSIHALEKMVRNGDIRPAIADLDTGIVTPYDPNKDKDIGLYDMTVFGIDRPTITQTRAKNLVWVFEKAERRGMLSQYSTFGPRQN